MHYITYHCIILLFLFAETARLLVTLRTISLPAEVVFQLKNVKEKLKRVKKEYPHLRLDLEDSTGIML